ncbi:MAG: alpha-2-macroglobulin [Nitrospirae bacterium]|nr:MAG: alpha-2-macroglobulin [Nitrospirota bacterium]
MKLKALFPFLIFYLFFISAVTYAAGPYVEIFSPQDTVKKVRQVSVRFSEQMVPFGDPRLVEPFEIRCPGKGQGRWADGKNWAYDFDVDLPAGVVCEFNLKPDLKTLSGKTLSGQKQFSFSTGGPAIIWMHPYEGSTHIDEDQIFILAPDAEPVEDTVLSNVACSIEGINERVGVRVLKAEEREKILKAYRYRPHKDREIVLQCKQSFPNNAKVNLIWGKGVSSLSGVKTTADQILPYQAREAFGATFNCQRENPNANCIPLLPMHLNFSSPVSWGAAKNIILRGQDKVYKPSKGSRNEYDEEGEETATADNNFVYGVIFKGPFPESSSFVIELPKDIRDDAGRTLANKDKFPLAVRTDAYPPLAKFSARFGIIELKGDPALPVTLRNLEPEVKTRMLKIDDREKGIIEKSKESLLENTAKAGEFVNSLMPDSMKGKGNEVVEGLKGRLHKIQMNKEEKVIDWLRKVAAAEREISILKNEGDIKDFSVPKPSGSKAFEVVGIPLKEPGFYVVEMESRILGKSLLEAKRTIIGLEAERPMYVPASALITNLSAHFKWGRESSLVWVTTLDKAEAVKEANVSIRNCKGELLWKGKTDENGVAKIKTQLPLGKDLPECPLHANYGESSPALTGIGSGLFVFAKKSDDMTFVHSSWDNGIEPWRFNLPEASYQGPEIGHTVFDRSLLRAGETVHMKHLIRKHTMSGFSFLGEKELPKALLIRHSGSNQRYEFPLKWDANGIAETDWKIPREAKLGLYEVVLLKKASEKPKARTEVGGYEEGDEGYYYPDGWHSGSFRVEEYRVPLMKGMILMPKEPLINVSEFEADLLVTYLSGGGAGNATVKLRSQIQPRYAHFTDYEDFTFANGEIKEEVIKRSDYEDTENQRIRPAQPKIQTSELVLDKTGSLRTKIGNLPMISSPQDMLAELEFRDPNGEIQTVSQRIPLWNSKAVVGIKPDSWASSRDAFKFHVVVLDIGGKPVKDADVKVELFKRKYFSHRKRLVGGFYAYEHTAETKRVGDLCEGRTNAKGLLICEVQSPVYGNVIIQAKTKDDLGNLSAANRDVWIAGKGEWWFDVSDSDRIDLLPEKKKYEPGDTAKFQVRMPFRKARALVTVEREGIIEVYIKKLSGKSPVIEIPIKSNYAPNVFVSAFVIRGRVSGIQPAAIVDLGKPAYKLGITEINVGWKAHELKVEVSAAKNVYRVREKAKVKVKVKKTDNSPPPKGSEVTIAAVDEGLLELMPNSSWGLLDAMMGRRGIEIRTSTAQMQVIGKRHYGLKALPYGGGGGKQVTRELFDTLLYWKARVGLNEKGEASVEIPLNDSLTGFRIVAIANGGAGLFGTGQTNIRTTQDIMILSGIPQIVREGDKFTAGFTVRNASDRKMELDIKANISVPGKKELDPVTESLSAGEAKEIGWEIKVPYNSEALVYEVTAKEKGGDAQDTIKIKQRVKEAVSVRPFQATLAQVENVLSLDVEKPKDAITGKGGVNISLRPKLSNGLGGVIWFMKRYPYTCMEQKVSRAVALRDEVLWKAVVAELPSYLDGDGLVKYFPTCRLGSDSLTAYILSISNEAGWEIPGHIKSRMTGGLTGFIEGRVIRYSSLPTADLSIRKMAALEALSRVGGGDPRLLGSITIEPNLWPTSAVIDWTNVLLKMNNIPEREKRLKESEQILRSRLNFQGTTMGFSTEGTDYLWWLMVSADVNSVRSILTFLNFESWVQDMPRLVRGALGRQYRGYWNLTTANAWGVLAMEKFSKKFEAIPVTGMTSASLNEKTKTVDWSKAEEGKAVMLGWPKGKETLKVSHQGTGKPWATIQSLAAIPLKEPFSSGYKIKKTLTPIEQRVKDKWSKGDVVRVRLDLESQADMTWVVVNDPIPGGSNILGTGLGRDSHLLTKGEERKGWVWPVFEERSFEAFRVYYEFVPKGKWTVEYTLRLNNDGVFHLPETRVEALYSPEMLGEIPNKKMEIGE